MRILVLCVDTIGSLAIAEVEGHAGADVVCHFLDGVPRGVLQSRRGIIVEMVQALEDGGLALDPDAEVAVEGVGDEDV